MLNIIITVKNMSFVNTIFGVRHSIQTVLQNGANILYDRYLDTKLPEHLSSQINKSITQNNNINFLKHEQKNQLKQQKQSKNNNLDTLQVNSLRIQTSNSLENIQRQNYATVDHQNYLKGKQHKKGIKPNVSIKYFCEKYDQQKQYENKLRNERIERGNMRVIIEREVLKRQQQYQVKKKGMQKQFKQLSVKGNGYTYDYNEDNLIQIKQANPQNTLIRLKYNTIDQENLNIARSQKICLIKGKHIGLYRNIIKKKQKITNQQYNNNEQRQFSTIPFMNLGEGVKVIESDVNVVAHRRRSCEPNRYDYANKIQDKNFRPHILNKQITVRNKTNTSLSLQRGTERPSTTNYVSGKNTAETNRTKRSILWRVQTAKPNHKINYNKNLFEEMIMD